MGKRRFERAKEQSVTARVAEASSPTESQTTRRRRGRPRKNLEHPEDFKKEESDDYEEYEKDKEEVEIIKQKTKVSSSGVEEEGQKWKLEEEEKKPEMTVVPPSYRRSRRKNTPVKSW